MQHRLTPDNIPHLRVIGGYWYLATPYTRYHAGPEAAFVEAARCAAWLVRQGLIVYTRPQGLRRAFP